MNKPKTNKDSKTKEELKRIQQEKFDIKYIKRYYRDNGWSY